jgi:hypothetical protein
VRLTLFIPLFSFILVAEFGTVLHMAVDSNLLLVLKLVVKSNSIPLEAITAKMVLEPLIALVALFAQMAIQSQIVIDQ